jgi:ArsR family transcriptional regulator
VVVKVAPVISALDTRPITRMFRALGDDTRLRIIALLAHGELCVCHIQAALELGQSNASRQMGILKSAGIVDHRRDGSWVYYRLVDQPNDVCARQLRELVTSFAKQDILRRDVARLRKVCGPGSCD